MDFIDLRKLLNGFVVPIHAFLLHLFQQLSFILLFLERAGIGSFHFYQILLLHIEECDKLPWR